MESSIYRLMLFSFVVLLSQVIEHLGSNRRQEVDAISTSNNLNLPIEEWVSLRKLGKVDQLLHDNQQQKSRENGVTDIDSEQQLQLQGKSMSSPIATRHEYEPSSCQLSKVLMVLQRPGCQSKAISTHACAGTCPSYVQVSRSKDWQHERSCSCCQQTAVQEDTFVLDCPGLIPPYREVKTYAPVNCICRSCSDLARENIRPQELVEALEGQSLRTY